MGRSKWKGTMVTTFAWAGMAWGQVYTLPIARADGNGEQYLNVRESDQSVQRCRVLRSWRLEDGTPAFEVRNTATNETMTIVESPTASVDMPPMAFPAPHGTTTTVSVPMSATET